LQGTIPNRSEALRLHTELGSSAEVVEHCEAVARIANKIGEEFQAKGIAVDLNAVRAAALLHDIGRSKVQTVAHGYVGAEILRERGVDESVTRIVLRHVGAGISKEEAEKFGFPEGDYVPRTLEEKIVCFADKVTGPRGKLVPFQLEVDKFRRKGLDVQRLQTLRQSLADRLGEDPEVFLK
jgi:uncharacterized protein